VDRNEDSFTSKPMQQDLLHGLEHVEPDYLAGNAPDLDIRDKLRVFLKEALTLARKNYGLSRDRVVDRINLCLAEEDQITERQLNGWLAVSAEDRPFPLHILPAFIWATRGNLSPLEVVTESLGLHLMDHQEVIAARLGENIINKTRAAKEERELRNLLVNRR